MTREIINTNRAPDPVGPYNQGVSAGGVMLYLSGQIAIDPETGLIVGVGDVAAQTERCLESLKAVLEAGGASLDTVVKTTVFLKDMNDFADMNAVYAQYFAQATAPARACVEVARLPKDVLIEVDCIAALPPC